MIKLKKILCPIDFSICSKYALNYAIDLSLKNDAKIYLIYVVETHLDEMRDILKQSDLLPNNQYEEDIHAQLNDLIPENTKKNIQVETIVVKGIPYVEIIKAAKDLLADLIVMGTHGRTGLEHILIGSVAERVIQKAQCPVLSIRHPKQIFSLP